MKLFAVLLCFVVLTLAFAVGAHLNNGNNGFKFMVAVDAGSTHSQAILFQWPKGKPFELRQIDSCDVNPGISSYAGSNVKEVGKKLIICIKNMVNGKANLNETPISIAATAGMRILKMNEPPKAKMIFEILKANLKQNGFHVKKLGIISGANEALYAWITTNFINGLFSNKGQLRPLSVVDMGGASTQIAQSRNITKYGNRLMNIRVFGRNYSVVTFSNLCFGDQQGFLRYLSILINQVRGKSQTKDIQVACLPKGYRTTTEKFNIENSCHRWKTNGHEIKEIYNLIGTGSPNECRTEIFNKVLNYEECGKSFQVCFQMTNEDKQFDYFAISGFEFSSSSIKMKSNISTLAVPYDVYLKKTDELCSTEYKILIQTVPEKFAPTNCFNLIYNFRTLTYVYGFNKTTWDKLRFSSKIGQTRLGWITGYTILNI